MISINGYLDQSRRLRYQKPSEDARLQFQERAQEYDADNTGRRPHIVLCIDTATKDLLGMWEDIHSNLFDLCLGQMLCSGSLRVMTMVGHWKRSPSDKAHQTSNTAKRGGW